jgi:hypothetical protein
LTRLRAALVESERGFEESKDLVATGKVLAVEVGLLEGHLGTLRSEVTTQVRTG